MVGATLIGIASSSGVPLFIRHVGSGKQPPYPLIASLNGLHVFGEAQGVTIWKAASQNSVVIWKTFHDSIRLILIRGSETSGDYADHILLDLAFASLVLLNGLNNIVTQNNIERLKKDLRLCYSLLDEILARAVGLRDSLIFSHLTNCADYVMPPDQMNIQPELDKYTEHIEASYGCLLLKSGQMLFATKNFWGLSRIELVLLPMFLSSKPTNESVGRDVPIYLPDKSPNIPFRMLVTLLASPLILVSLCGPTPSLSEALKSASNFWGSHYLTLDAIVMATICSIPSSIHSTLDKAILGLLLVNYEKKRCLTCLQFKERNEIRPRNNTRNTKTGTFRSSVLASVYRSLVGSLLHPPGIQQPDIPSLNLQPQHSPVQAYITAEEFKVYVYQKPPYQFFVLYPPLLPVHIAREVTAKSFDSLTKNKGSRM